MLPSAQFEQCFQTYLNNAKYARDHDQHHDHRRNLFLEFLKDAFGIGLADVQTEQFIRLDMRRHGWIDALFRYVLFEFKRDLERERLDGIREMQDYLRHLEYGSSSAALLTDGIIFEVYTLEDGEVREKVGAGIDLEKVSNAEAAFLWLDSYLFSQQGIPPTSADIVRRYGSTSPTFHVAAQTLGNLLEQISDTPALNLKRSLWRGLLAKVYGSDIGSDELFVRHTYLNQLAKLLAYTALHNEAIPHDDTLLANIVSGEAFNSLGVNNLGEIDFFAWILEEEVKADALAMLRRLAQSLAVYDLERVDEDLLKQLYQNLVDPETRHGLGEFYTPDWLAELTLRTIEYRPGQSLLDPACGSGTFLFTAIRRLAEQGLAGWELVDFALENIMGMDVHPLAVTIARINYLLAIIPHMRGPRASQQAGLVPLPVYMADTLQTPLEEGTHKDTLVVPVDAVRGEAFHIPVSAAESPAEFNQVIEQMEAYARYPVEELNLGLAKDFRALVQRQFGKAERGGVGYDLTTSYWGRNLTLLNKLIYEQRNSIWAYMLKNVARPLLLMEQKFDVIAGNPPWLTYKDIRDKTYQSEIRSLTTGKYELVDRGDRKLFTQLELSTLFMVHSEAMYLKPGGTIAFVMPRSTISGAKQHRRFQARGFTKILDLLGVFPLFNVPSCVLIRQGDELHRDNVPVASYAARLPAHEMSYEAAQPYFTEGEATARLVGEVTVASPHYYEAFRAGASLFPRNLCFVKPKQTLRPGDAAVNPAMQTDPEIDREAKKPWKGVKLEGLVYGDNLFGTLLSKNLLPFGYRKLHLVALPVRLIDGSLKPMSETDFLRTGHSDSWRTWFKPAEAKWDELKKDTSTLDDLIDRYDYQRTLTSQTPYGLYKVLYNSSGVHVASCVIDTFGTAPNVHEYPTQGFIADYKTYVMETDDAKEAHYLCAVLNAPCVDTAIKPHQSRGKGNVGERDITRTPFEACAIPPFDPQNADHVRLARLSHEAHEIIAGTAFTGGVVKARSIAREAVAAQIAAIDEIAKRILAL